MKDFYILPITNEYETRGCKVTINASENPTSVDIYVENIKTGCKTGYRHVLMPGSERGYSDTDIKEIKDALNNMLDNYGDPECNEIHFTNQILS